MMPKTGSTGTLLSKLTAKAGSGKDQAFCHTPNSDKDKITGRALIIAYLILIIILSLSDIVSSFAQAPQKGLQVGDTIPGKFWHLPLQVAGHPQNKTSLTLNDYRGKLIILDFWATWCSPCVAMMPRIDSLQKAFDGRVQFLPVTYQKEAEVLPFMEKLQKQKGHRYDLPELTGDTVLHKFFPHTYLPHYVWIDGSGIVKAITEAPAVTASNINILLKEGRLAVREKIDEVSVEYDKGIPLFINGNGGDGKNLVFYNAFSPYVSGLPAGYDFFRADSTRGTRIVMRNITPLWLYSFAFGENKICYGKNRIAVEVPNPEELDTEKSGAEYLEWARSNTFCYELLVPPFLNSSFYSIMRSDLEKLFFKYSASQQKRKKVCLVLERTSKADKIRSAGGAVRMALVPDSGLIVKNMSPGKMVYNLNAVYMQNSVTPVIDNTGYRGKIDLQLKSGISDLKMINKALSVYDLKLTERECTIDILVISNKL